MVNNQPFENSVVSDFDQRLASAEMYDRLPLQTFDVSNNKCKTKGMIGMCFHVF